jgi:DNA helicase IV
VPDVREALERMWPVLTPAELLHDLFGSMALLRLAAATSSEREYKALYRPRSETRRRRPVDAGRRRLLDDAREVLGPKPGRHGKIDEADEIRTYGHIVIDEVQDLTPMQLKMADRRSLNGSMTVVGDIAQATGPLAPDDWDDVLRSCPTVAATGHRAVGRLPHPGADHGAREPGDGGRHPGPAGPGIGAGR